MPNTTQTPCPTENEGNIVNVNTYGCGDGAARDPAVSNTIEPKTYVFHEQEKPARFCSFDVYMTKVSVISNAKADDKAELMITGYANDQTGVFPGMGTFAIINPSWGWVNINTKVGSFRVKEGVRKSIYIRADVLEVDANAGGAPEFGSDEGDSYEDAGGNPVYMTLECDDDDVYHTEISVWAQKIGGKKNARIAIEFAAFPRECC